MKEEENSISPNNNTHVIRKKILFAIYKPRRRDCVELLYKN
jgi:hypothetical protein